MVQLELGDADVTGLLAGDVNALLKIERLARATARGPFARRGGYPSTVDSSDLVQTALYDAFTAVHSGAVRDGESLTRTVRRSVWRELKRAQREEARARKFYVDERFLEGLPSPEQLVLEEYSAEGADEVDSAAVRLVFEQAKSPEQEARTRLDLITVDDELIAHLRDHPDEMYALHPRRFEELIAAILRNLGYSIELTGRGADGGVDIIATQKSGIGESLLIVDCKRYGPRKPVGVGIVRSLYGIAEQMRASLAMLATTSFFTAPAREFQRTVRYRISLKEYGDLLIWLNSYGHIIEA